MDFIQQNSVRLTGNNQQQTPYHIQDMPNYVTTLDQSVWFFTPHEIKPRLTYEEAINEMYGIGVNSMNRFEVMMLLFNRLNCELVDKFRFLKSGWPDCDGVSDMGPTLLNKLDTSHEFFSFHAVLDDDERSWIDGLGDKFRIYRGCNETEIAGVSWTTDHNVAQKFAEGFRGFRHRTPVIVSATCELYDVLLATNEREEKEIIINPENLTNVLVRPITTE